MPSLVGAIVEVIATIIGLVIYGYVYASLNTAVLGSNAIALLSVIPIVLIAVLIIGLLQIFGRV